METKMRAPSAAFAVTFVMMFVVLLVLPRTTIDVFALAGTAFAAVVFSVRALDDRSPNTDRADPVLHA
jgi:hypothetical protein